ncbi:hypothetical protein ACLRGF_05485 [Mycetocola zhadangensis]|uniref:ApeA N-terminal domain 1-containing protein n=1 Tax=Mycetocola zhadangensis TaxID=1164595 RepID=UPI003A4DA39F
MGMRHLEFGDSLSGLLIDGVADTPYVGAGFKLTRDKGVTVEVPYLSSRDVTQFSHVQAWFNDQAPPTNMLLLTPEGTISLFDIAWSGHSESWGGRRTSIGTMRPDLAVLAPRDGALDDPLVMAEMHSRLDGLNEWSRLSAVSEDTETDEEGRIQSVTMLLHRDDGITWQQGDATMTIRAGWFHSPEQDGYGRKTTVEDNVHIESTFGSGSMPFWDHFVEHRKIANLMVFLFGRPLSFRQHKLRDDLFASRMNDGRIYDHPLTEIISRHTYPERRTEVPSKKALGHPIAHMTQVGDEGLETWSENYDTWERFILPSVSVLGRTGSFIEDIVISTSMSIEAAGGIIGERAGERQTWGRGRPTAATYVYRSLDALDVRWPERIQDRVGLSRAIARTYNDVKHYDRGDFPDHAESYVVSEINQMIVRLMAIHITGRGEELLSTYREGNNLYEIAQILDGYGLRVDESGRWHRDTDNVPPE